MGILGGFDSWCRAKRRIRKLHCSPLPVLCLLLCLQHDGPAVMDWVISYFLCMSNFLIPSAVSQYDKVLVMSWLLIRTGTVLSSRVPIAGELMLYLKLDLSNTVVWDFKRESAFRAQIDPLSLPSRSDINSINCSSCFPNFYPRKNVRDAWCYQS